MPNYRVTDPGSGRTVTLTGDSPPTEQELEEVFSSLGGKAPAQDAPATAPEAPKAAPTLGAALAPKTSKALDEGVGPLRTTLAAGTDLLTGISRVPRALARTADTQMGFGQKKQGFTESLDQINRGKDLSEEDSKVVSALNSPALVAGAVAAPFAAGMAGGTLGPQALRAAPKLQRLLGAAGLETTVATAAEQAENVAETGKVNPEQAAMTAAFGFGMPLGGQALGAAGKTLRGATASTRIADDAGRVAVQGAENLQTIEKGLGPVDPALLETRPSGLRLTPGQAVGERAGLRASLEKFAQANPILQDIPAARLDENLKAIGANVEGQAQRLGIGHLGGDPAQGSFRGRNIDQTVREGKAQLGKTFQQAEDASMAKIAGNQLAENRAFNALDEHLAAIGYRGGNVNQTMPVGRDAIETVLEMQNEVAGARSVQELLNVKRNVANIVYKKQAAGAAFDTKDNVFIKSAERKINESLKTYFDDFLPPEEARAAREVWEQANADFSNNLSLLRDVGKGLGVGSQNFKSQTVIDKISHLDVERLADLRTAAEMNSVMKDLHQEISRGAFEAVFKKSINPNSGELSPDRLVTTWAKMDQRMKNVLFPEEVVQGMDGLVGDMRRMMTTDINKANPSGTAKQSMINEFFTNTKASTIGLAMRPLVARYYETGEVPLSSIFNLVRVGGKSLVGIGSTASAQPVRQATVAGVNEGYSR